jgi:hypothetical protein
VFNTSSTPSVVVRRACRARVRFSASPSATCASSICAISSGGANASSLLRSPDFSRNRRPTRSTHVHASFGFCLASSGLTPPNTASATSPASFARPSTPDAATVSTIVATRPTAASIAARAPATPVASCLVWRRSRAR